MHHFAMELLRSIGLFRSRSPRFTVNLSDRQVVMDEGDSLTTPEFSLFIDGLAEITITPPQTDEQLTQRHDRYICAKYGVDIHGR
jgi:hypothetical protein